MIRLTGTVAVALALIASALAAAPAGAAPPVQPYGANDYGGFRNILPPGQGRNATLPEIIQNQIGGALPPNFANQRPMYGDLVYASPSLSAANIGQYFKDGSFGVKPADVAAGSPYSPRAGVTIIRDAPFGVPHVYGTTRGDVMFGAGYVGAEDRLFFMDSLRNSGRGKLSEFAGGANKSMDAGVWDDAPYTEADLQRQYDQADDLYGAEGAQLQQDVSEYVAGINAYLAVLAGTPALRPGEYALLGQTLEPWDETPWKVTDVIATAALIGGIFGKGGGGEVSNAEIFSAAKARFGKVKGIKVWRDFRRANDAEAPTTVEGRRFPYQVRKPGRIKRKAVAIPDRGSLVPGSPDDATTQGYSAAASARGAPGGGEPTPRGLLDGLMEQQGASNALLVSGKESQSGHPLAVFGPQVSYYSPQILMEEDLHGPDFDASGTSFVGINLYVLLGRGQDYSWSATSAGQDIIDTFAEKLCEPGGGKPTINSMHYLWNGQCRPIEVLTRVNNITPNAVDPSPAEAFRLEAQRTVHGVISERGKVNGKPVAFARLRSTYGHEADSALGFSAFNSPSKMRNARDFQENAHKIGFSFNWLYADDRDIAYFNSGFNPVRAKGTDPEFPNWGTGKFDWKGWNPSTNVSRRTSFDSHPQVINQPYISSWNNKQAPGFSAAEDTYSYGSIHRAQSLNERIEARIGGAKKTSLVGLIDAMEDAGTVDLRGSQVLPWLLAVIKEGKVPKGLRDEVKTLSAWVRSGAHRRDFDRSGAYDEAAAVQLMDAWWPKLLERIYRPKLGKRLFEKLRSKIGYDNPPGPGGSAYISGWYAYVEKDLRALLGRKVTGRYSRNYCASGKTRARRINSCRRSLIKTLSAAATVPRSQLYPKGDNCATGDDQVCHDAVRFTTLGGIAIKEIHWINRPTWQQVVEVLGHRGRGTELRCSVPRIGSKVGERLQGSAFPDDMFGKGGDDRLYAEGGDDCLNGGAGDDLLVPGGGADSVKGGGGDDDVRAAEGTRDVISCGGGSGDTVLADRRDRVSRDCERVKRSGAQAKKKKKKKKKR